MTTSEHTHFLQTISGLLDGTLAHAETEQLLERLETDAEAPALYLKYVAFNVHLEWSCSTRSTKDIVVGGPPAVIAPTKRSSTDPSNLGARAQTRSLSPALFSQRSSFFSRANLCYVALVALCLYGSFALVAWNLRPDKLLNVTQTNPASVAVVRATTDLQWSNNASSKTIESSIVSGDALKIESGTIELELGAGAEVVIEGPADWSVDGKNNVSLRTGKLLAHVPKQAIGFTVETPTAIVVDLGTEFGIETSQRGTTEVHVLKGKVELHPNVKHRDTSSATQPITLVAGEARRIEQHDRNGDVIVREVTLASDRFKRRPLLAEVQQIKVEGAYASSTPISHDISADYLIRGQGMKGDCHSAKCQYTMWIADYMRIKDEFVLFDLARPHRLDSMKVWNWNQFGMPWICLKQADIYVSTSGKGDPLSQPAEWKLMVDDQQFAPGTGKDDYDTPTVIPLGKVEARFVAIVIDDACGRDPRGPEAQHDCVGLSEVQFFGSRVESKSKK